MNAHIDISSVTLHTPRLILRPWREDDLEDFYAYARVDGVGEAAGWLHHESKDFTKQILSSFITGKKTFALEKDGRVIGSLGVEEYRTEELMEYEGRKGRALGYVLSKDYWGQGLMTEAVQAVVSYLFKIEKLDFLVIYHYSENARSGRVAGKCGFLPLRKTVHTTVWGEAKETWIRVLERP